MSVSFIDDASTLFGKGGSQRVASLINNMKNKLDVLITFYNQEQYVDIALKSVFDQKCNFDFRVLIGDDGSNDNTIINIEKWMEKYPEKIFVFRMDRDAGKKYIGGFRASQNRLNLLHQVKAPYFIFLDGDDYFTDDNKFQKQIDILDDKSNADCIACSHAIEALYDDGTKKIYPWQNLKEGKYSLSDYWSDIYFHTDTSIIRSETIKTIPFDLVKNHYNDNMITFLAFQSGKVYYIPEVMACYKQTGDGIWTGGNIVSNCIRNMMLYDLSIIIAPDLEKQTGIRFYNAWKNLYKHRKEIDEKKLILFKEDARKNNLIYTSMWINYKYITPTEQQNLKKKLCVISKKRFLYKAKKRLTQLRCII